MSYSLVSPEQFTEKQKQYVERFRRAIEGASKRSATCFGAKDIHSRHIVATDAYARIVGLAKGGEVAGRFDREMPCEGTARFADCYVREDSALLARQDPNRMTSVLNVHEYSDGLKALVFDKFTLEHRASRAILGTIYSARRVDLSRFFTTLPTYTFEFGLGCSIECTDSDSVAADIALTDHEHEVAFLFAMNWPVEQIAQFMRSHTPLPDTRVLETLAALAEKFGEGAFAAASLREKLIDLRVHQKMPRALFDRLIGSASL